MAEKRKQKRKWALPPRKWFGLFLLAGSPLTMKSYATDYADIVRQDAEQAIQQHAQSQGWVNFNYSLEPWVPRNIDKQPTCTGSIEAQPARETGRLWGRVPYLIRCTDPSWEIRARADVTLTVPVVTARRNIARNETLNHSTMVLAERDLANIYGDFVTDTRQLTGQRAKRALRSGQVITLNQAAAPLLVERGDQVTIRVSAGGISASMTGEALQSGSKGNSVRVRNHSSGKVITAWVVEKGIVETRF